MNPLIAASDLRHEFGATVALDGASLELARGETVALMGPSGSGKSTLLHCLAGILPPTAGSVVFEGQSLHAMSEAQRSDLRLRRFGFVFQFGDLVPELTLAENVALPVLLAGTRRREAESTARDLLDRLGVGDVADRRAGAVSGGQAQRAAVGRALVHRPAVVFADEPTGSLDTVAGEAVLDLLMSMSAEEGSTVLLVTHDNRVAAHADREIVIRDGRLSARVSVPR